MPNTLTIVLIIITGLAVIIFLVLKNKKDKKIINPDAQDSVDEVIMEKNRDREKI
jgi:hypothetical protein